MRSSDDGLTELLSNARAGDADALARAGELILADLRSLAHRARRGQRPNHTLGTTALVNEAFVRLLGQPGPGFEGRQHFYGVAAKAMRSILVDYARARNAEKRGGGWERRVLDDVLDELGGDQLNMLALDEALRRLEATTPRHVRVVELRYFAGLSIAKTAEALGVSSGTVESDWRFARAWLQRELSGEVPA
ncbi:MAG: sigma-70 family RNA polymerase sigma factor [Planctomycetota bacterium]